jgi:hypothetical protein
MSAPLPKEPLDEPIMRFVTAVKEFLAIKPADVDPPTQTAKTQNPLDDLKRSWEEGKRHLRRCHEALVGAEPEVDERLQRIVSVGSEVISLTDDPHIVGPVESLVRLASEERVDVGNIISRFGQATSVLTVLTLLAESLGFRTRSATRGKEIATTLDALTAYYLLEMPPRDTA